VPLRKATQSQAASSTSTNRYQATGRSTHGGKTIDTVIRKHTTKIQEVLKALGEFDFIRWKLSIIKPIILQYTNIQVGESPGGFIEAFEQFLRACKEDGSYGSSGDNREGNSEAEKMSGGSIDTAG
jgi:hypothetical protein